jgi:NADH-dependent peroxiredoxin subunit F
MQQIYDLIIIGAGPAGVAAAVYAARQKLNLLVVSKDMGGQIAKKAVDIENYPGFEKISGPNLIKLFAEQLEKNEVKIEFDEVVKIEKKDKNFEVSAATGEKFLSKTVIMATGGDPRPLEVAGEKEFVGRGVSYCALCDGPVFKNKDVAVIGGGNAGFESALFLANYVNKIYILEFLDVLRADPQNQELIKKTGKAEIITGVKVLKIEGDDFVKSLIYKNTKTGEEKKLEVQGVFVEIGYSPATSFVKDLVDFSERDEILSDLESYETKTPGLFAAGDCNKGRFKQIVTAAGEGAKAALAAYEYIQKNK